MFLIIGLGNPGKDFVGTRHNVGFMALDFLANKYNLHFSDNKKFSSSIAVGNNFILVKPQTFMNDSGLAVSKILNFYNIDLKKVLVIHDDLDIDLGKYKLAENSRSAGHNGVKSIFQYLKTQQVPRIRVGIRKKVDYIIDAKKFVLEKFSHDELSLINKVIGDIFNDQKIISML